jgi:D-aminopeptidase
MPICSITKQFTCSLLLTVASDPSDLDGAIRQHLPHLDGVTPRIVDLCNNQSGLRDYWALTTLCGAAPEGVFTADDAKNLIGRSRSLHFTPGEQYSYSNGNFRILANIIEHHAGQSFGDLLSRHLFKPAGMEMAVFCADTAGLPGDACGYEGNVSSGFMPAINRINAYGDGGICASLDDMIAWEQFIHRSHGDDQGIYNRISTRQHFSDSKLAQYSFGLAHMERSGVKMTAHGGGVRGWRSYRCHAATEGISVIVLFNHEADAAQAALDIFDAALGIASETAKPAAMDPAWLGHYHDPESDLVLDVENAQAGDLTARFTDGPEPLTPVDSRTAWTSSMTLRRDDDLLFMERPMDNLRVRMPRLTGQSRRDLEGHFHCVELDADFICAVEGGQVYGACEGFLGKGPMQPLYAIASDIWLLPSPRAMDVPSPDWILHFQRDGRDKIAGVTIGCWLARLNSYVRQ